MPSRWNKLRQMRRFADDGKTLSLLHFGPNAPAFRFSARLWWLSRGAQTCQQFVHPAPHLLRRSQALFAFPRTQCRLNQVARQNQMIVNDGDDLGPALKLFWGAQTRLFPQECLFVKTVAVLLSATASISQADLCDIGLGVSHPGKPTHTRVAFFVGRMWTHHANDRHVQPPCLLDVHLLPPGNFDRTTLIVRAVPRSIWLSMGCARLGLQFRSIFASPTFFAK